MTTVVADDELVVSKPERAYRWIRERIVEHDYPPGHRLVLARIADELRMSVVPVREAIRRLEAEGFVSFERNVGARVSVVDEQAYIDTMQTLSVIEGYATALAAARLTEADLARATELNERMTREIDQLDAHVFTELNQRFHAVLYARCPNPQIVELVHRSWSRLSDLRDTTFAVIPDRPRRSVEEHARILALVRGGADPAEIEHATRTHRLRTLDAFVAARRAHTTQEEIDADT